MPRKRETGVEGRQAAGGGPDWLTLGQTAQVLGTDSDRLRSVIEKHGKYRELRQVLVLGRRECPPRNLPG